MGRFCFFLFWGLLAVGCAGQPAAPPATPTLSPQAQQGEQVFSEHCGSCHSLASDTIIVGPSLASIASLASSRVAGQDAQTYLLISILRPTDYLVDGFEPKMPDNFGKKLTGEEVDSVVAFLLTVK